jgi:GntR family transcriptional regulator / MocR family aminotransferase
MDPLFEIHLDVSARKPGEVSQALFSQLKAAIVAGRLAAGTRLPATRQGRRIFGVSRNTAAAVYEELLNGGFVVTRRGSGTFVAEQVPHRPAHSNRANKPRPEIRLNPFWLQPEVEASMGFWQEACDNEPGKPIERPRIDFRPALVDSRLFPFGVFRRVSARQLRALERRPASYKSPQGNQGNYHLRTAITRHIALTRAVACAPADVLVASGAQQAFDLLARTLVTPGETIVAVEDPGYPPMRVAFAAAGARLVPVPVDAEGLIVERLPRNARVISLCPSHQFPLGVPLSTRRRKALIDFASTHGAAIIEDDYDGEFRFANSPLVALKASDAAHTVFYVGTFSKCMLPALRLGFIVAPAWAMRTLVAAKNCLDWHCSVPLQLAVARFISEGHLARHVRKMREAYRRRRELLLELLDEKLAEWLKPLPSFYGMHVAALARGAFDLERVAQALQGSDVRLHTLRRYYLDQPTESGIVIGYGAADLAQIARGMSLLRNLLRAI